VDLIRGQGENILIDTGNWTTPEYDNGMGQFLIEKLDQQKQDLKYILITHFHYDHTGNASELLPKRCPKLNQLERGDRSSYRPGSKEVARDQITFRRNITMGGIDEICD
jgi:glyoxylase-like metal-dependent hydrolase (beta-lactamase superfamily II)